MAGTGSKRIFLYEFDDKRYLVRHQPLTDNYEILIHPGTADVKVIGSAWRRRPVRRGFSGKLSVDIFSFQREIACYSLKDLVWWLAYEYHWYLKEVARSGD